MSLLSISSSGMIHPCNNNNNLINHYNTIAVANSPIVRVDCSAIT